MREGQIRAALNSSVVGITKGIMGKYGLGYEAAYKKLMNTEFFDLLNDIETGLYLEPMGYLCEACELEMEKGVEAMKHYISL